jgi:uncharacterized protein (TIGR02118 family)
MTVFDVFASYARPADETAFASHYRAVHVPLTLAMPGLLEFTWGLGDRPESHVVARMTFRDEESADAAFASPEGAAAAGDLASFAGAGVHLVRVPREPLTPTA